MLRFKKLVGGKYCIIENKDVYLFDKTGNCIQEKVCLSPEYLNGSLEMNYISILSTSGGTEVAVFNKDMTKYKSDISSQDCVMLVYNSINFLCFLRRNGEVEGVKFTQAIFVLGDTYPNSRLVELLKLKEIH